MMKSTLHTIPLSLDVIEQQLELQPPEYILQGLLRNHVGFLIAQADTGKSYLCLSIAYELALQQSLLLGLRPPNAPTLRTLIWSVEDGIKGALPRIKKHLQFFSPQVQQQIAHHVYLYTSDEPVCCSAKIQGEPKLQAKAALEQLIIAAQDFDLVIIDTLRDAIGSADEVQDDYVIRSTFEALAKQADVAVLLVHHPTKNVARGHDQVNTVAASGLSTTLTKTKLHLYLEREINAKSGEINTYLRHTKANYIELEARLLKQPLFWNEQSLLYRDPLVLERLTQAEEVETKKKRKRHSSLDLTPQIIPRNEKLLSETSKRLADNPHSNPFGQSLMSELAALKKKDQV